MTIALNLAKFHQLLSNKQITLVAASKNANISEIEEAFACGITEFGESRVQDAFKKQQALPPHLVPDIHWHFIGHLQTNKVKQVVGRFSLIQSVDSLHLAQEISVMAVKSKILQPILLQVKILEDTNKSGFLPEQLHDCFAEISELPSLKIKGLMTMAPLTCDQKTRLDCFSGARKLKEDLEKSHKINMTDLSMGMSDDWQEALECGATMLRLGRTIFQK